MSSSQPPAPAHYGTPQTESTRWIVGFLMREYPVRTVVVVVLVLLAGLAEGVGVAALLPLLGLATGADGQTPDGGISGQVADLLASFGITYSVEALLVLIVVGMALKAALTVLAHREAGYVAARVAADLRLALIRGLMHARWEYFTRQPSGKLSNALSSEAQRASAVFVHGTKLAASTMQVIVYLGLAFAVSWQIALTALALGLVMVASLNVLVRVSRRAGRQQTAVLTSLISRLSDGLYALKPLKAMGREDQLQPLLESDTEELEAAQRRQVISEAAVRAAHEPIVAFFMAIIVYVLLRQVGVPFDSLLFVALLFQRTVVNLGRVQTTYQQVMTVESALWAIRHTIGEAGEAEETSRGGVVPDLERAIRFDGVSFDYGDKAVLRDLDLTIQSGRLTAVIGPSGAGKTTVADLVTGLYRPTGGEIHVDDTPMRDVDLAGWRRRIGYVPQDLVLFHDTVFVNVGMGDPSITRDDVERALRHAGAWEFVSAMPEGIDTVVGERGMRISGGQRQRISIARALVAKPALLILDEATTALDPDTERAILATVRDLRDQVTVLAISHQPTLVEAADHVFRLDPLSAGPVGSAPGAAQGA